MPSGYRIETTYGTATAMSIPQQPAPETEAKQDPTHTQDDFLRDLDKATQPRPSGE